MKRRDKLLLVAVFLFVALSARAARALFSHPRSFAYVLQAEALGQSRAAAVHMLAGCGRDWIIIDPCYETGREGRWRPDEIESIRAAHAGRKMLAYLSIGEAERYRPYWQQEWDADNDGEPDDNAPPWLCAENPDWRGNYKVRYWDSAWQDILLREVDEIVQAGFDGVYLDIVDAFEFFEFDPGKNDWIDGRADPATGKSYRWHMIEWVCRLAEHARREAPDFLVVAQNGIQLLDETDFLRSIDGVGIEDLYAEGNTLQSRAHVAESLGYLERARESAKPLFLIEYGTDRDVVRRVQREAVKDRLVPLVTDRALMTLGVSGVVPAPGN